jgi:hypothetical protein
VFEEILVHLGHEGQMTVTGVSPPAGTVVTAVNGQIERFQRAEEIVEKRGGASKVEAFLPGSWRIWSVLMRGRGFSDTAA